LERDPRFIGRDDVAFVVGRRKEGCMREAKTETLM
jgi:hypothetical protein